MLIMSSLTYIFQESKSSSGRWNFQCQHGKEECIGNLIEVGIQHTGKCIRRFGGIYA